MKNQASKIVAIKKSIKQLENVDTTNFSQRTLEELNINLEALKRELKVREAKQQKFLQAEKEEKQNEFNERIEQLYKRLETANIGSSNYYFIKQLIALKMKSQFERKSENWVKYNNQVEYYFNLTKQVRLEEKNAQ